MSRHPPELSSYLVLITGDCRSTHGLLVCNFKGSNLLIFVHLPKIIYDLWGSLESRVTSGEVLLHHPEDSYTAWGCQQPPVWYCTISIPLEHKHQSWGLLMNLQRLLNNLEIDTCMNKCLASPWCQRPVNDESQMSKAGTTPFFWKLVRCCCILWLSKHGKHGCLRSISPGKNKLCQRI